MPCSNQAVSCLQFFEHSLESVVGEATERPHTQFHLSMRLRPIEQMIDRLAALVPDAETKVEHAAPPSAYLPTRCDTDFSFSQKYSSTSVSSLILW